MGDAVWTVPAAAPESSIVLARLRAWAGRRWAFGVKLGAWRLVLLVGRAAVESRAGGRF